MTEIFCWDLSPSPLIQRFTWSNREQFSGLEALRVAASFRAIPAGRRALFFWHALHNAFAMPAHELIRRGPNLVPHKAWYSEFFHRLAAAGIEPDRIILDVEDGFSIWSVVGSLPLGEARVRAVGKVYDAAGENLPNFVRRHDPSAYATHDGAGIPAYNDFSLMGFHMTASAIVSAIGDSAEAAFGRKIPMSNYQFSLSAFPVTDPNGWIIPSVTSGDWSSPTCYLWGRGNDWVGRKKPAPWNAFIHCVNLAVAARRASDRVIPWVSIPTFDEGGGAPPAQKAWLWRRLIRHMKSIGIDRFIFFNVVPKGQAPGLAEDAAAAEWLLRPVPATQPDTRPAPGARIPNDADEVITNGEVTTFDEFRRQ